MVSRRWYVADSRTRTRLLSTHRSLAAAQARTARLNAKPGNAGRYQCGDWVHPPAVGVDEPREWPWTTTGIDHGK